MTFDPRIFGRRRAERRSTRVGVRRELSIVYIVAALALILVSAGALLASRAVARTQALHDAERITTRLANNVIGPLLISSMDGDPAKWAELQKAVVNRLGDGYLHEITVWGEDGLVVYSNESDEIGVRVEPPAEVIAAIEHGDVSSDFENQPEAGTKADGNDPDFVEVYVPFQLPDGGKLAFEAYYDAEDVQDVADSMFWYLIPLVLIPLVILQFIELPVTGSLAGRVRRHEAERSRMLELTLSVSERERIRIAADLHDGPIQDLAGIGFALDAVAPTVPQHNASLMRGIQDTVRHAIESLRWLIFDVYPPDLSGPQLPHIIETLAAPLRSQGIDVLVDVEPLPELNRDILTTVYRVARETLANVAEHARADKVDITLVTEAADQTGSGRFVRLIISDNGIGVTAQAADRRDEGHFGIQLLRDRVESLGGSWTMAARSDGGTEITVLIPMSDPGAH